MDSRVVSSKGRRRIISFHGLLRAFVHIFLPADVGLALWASDRSCGGGLFALVMTSRILGAQLEALQLIYVLAKGGISVMMAAATHDMWTMWLVMEG